ncbi:BA14K family protein [Brevundimonas sp. SL130]|uniref:BA14K family protein n=1 Tax=Brevundimonas sp. SL130 TaxID=2995143 RepID=UPI00226D0A66|nr:BA14K family protein [Brevundimonas sp. SL130]WAC60565.1 BA14K family protein [Brevundimonas sp. SL130]
MRLALIAAVATALSSAPAVAQTWHEPPTRYDFHGQADRPGDYRCDAYWDAGRTDCGAAWRDQRPAHPRRYRVSGYGSGPSVYPGAYGRPDLVYPGGGSTYGHGDRDVRRMDWCRSAYRSYDPASGYYRTYDGRFVFCG